MSAPSVAVIVVAAGNGTRLGAGRPKAFVTLGDRSLLAHTLHSVVAMAADPQVVVVAPADLVGEATAIADAVSRESHSADITVVAGGATRQESVALGLSGLSAGIRTVLVHDAARPLTPRSLFDRVADAVEQLGHGVIPALPVSDTVKRTAPDGTVMETIDRSELSAVQTPQGFPRDILVAAYARARTDFTDDAALVADLGEVVTVIEGDPSAFKVTTPWDHRRAEEMIGSPKTIMRIGIGTDTHVFGDADDLWLAGLHWPHERGLAGHSDGDVVAHAIVDALLSAAGLGDIGGVFGTDDPRLSGAHGDVFLTETKRMLESNGFRIGNVSVQLVGNRPRFSGRRSEAEALLSGILAAPVSVSATTTDGLGFTGRGEGIAAIASATVHGPA